MLIKLYYDATDKTTAVIKSPDSQLMIWNRV
jgi:hypothetical protein